jgi:ATP-dependent Clp protease ATP-binding subunit ClpC
MAETKPTYFYQEPRLQMTIAGRFVVRLLTYGAYGVATIAGLIAWGSNVAGLHALGSLTILFLLSRLFAINKPERSLARLTPRHPNIAIYMAPESYHILEAAMDKALLHGGDVRLHVLKLLVARPEIKQVLIRLDVDAAAFLHKVEQYIQEAGTQPTSRAQAMQGIEKIVMSAFIKAANNYGRAVSPHYLFGAFGEVDEEHVKRLFTLFNITASDIETAFLFGKGRKTQLNKFIPRPFNKRHRVMNRAWTARPTPTLDEYSLDLTDMVRAQGGSILVGHKQEYGRLLNVLCRPGNPNALLVGDPGSGKSALLNYLAFEISRDRVPAQLFDHRLVQLSISDLSAGAEPTEIQARLKRVINEIVLAGNVILCIPDLHLLLKTGGGQQFSGADILVPAIKSGQFSVVGATYPKEYKQYIQQDNEFAGSFEPIVVPELSESEAVQYLVYASLVLEASSGITITFKSIKEAARIAHKYFRQKLLPSSAEDLMKEALAGVALRRERVLKPDDIVATAEQKVNVKMHTATDKEAGELLNLEATIHEKFIDQEEAVKAVANALREYRAGVTRKGGPISSFLFCGPTGVGKTELSKMLAATQFGSKDSMVRFDMTEYQDKQSFYRLIGSPDGTMRGALTEAVIEKPYCLVLLDEFEKAYPDILNLFLQVLDDGRLTDSFGRTVDFQNTIIIATSNAHSTLIKDELEKKTPMSTITDTLKKRLTEYFKPELINRFSQVVAFKPLSREDIVAVARLNLSDLSTTLAESQAVTLKYDESAIIEIARLGYDPLFGARPLRQAINDNLRSVLAEKLLRGQILRGDTVTVLFKEGAFSFEKQKD